MLQDDLRGVTVIFKHMRNVKVSCHRRNCKSCHALRDPVFFMADTHLEQVNLVSLLCTNANCLTLLVDRWQFVLPRFEGFSES